jgi:hypothetical protein
MTRGGSRQGAGRPKRVKNYSEEVKKDFLKSAKDKAKETGRTLGQVVIGLIYDENIQDSVRIAALKAWAEVVVVKESKQTIEGQRVTGPSICLPPLLPRPDRIKDEDGEKKLRGEIH